MWIMLNDAFFSIVKKDCPPDSLLVRARRPEDIEVIFDTKAIADPTADYLYRAVVPVAKVADVLEYEACRIDYPNFKDSVVAKDLKKAYNKVWEVMADVQNPPPYSQRRKDVRNSSKVD